jgi:hypothetical protein
MIFVLGGEEKRVGVRENLDIPRLIGGLAVSVLAQSGRVRAGVPFRSGF